MASLRTLSPDFRPYAEQFVDYLTANGLSVSVTSARRSFAEQTRLYTRYINGQSPYPAAVPGTSTHELGYAFDAVVSPKEYQRAAGEAWEKFGGRWGGRFRDPVHFEAPGVSGKAARQNRSAPPKRGAWDEPGLPHEDPIGTLVTTVVAPWWSGVVTDPILKWLDEHGL